MTKPREMPLSELLDKVQRIYGYDNSDTSFALETARRCAELEKQVSGYRTALKEALDRVLPERIAELEARIADATAHIQGLGETLAEQDLKLAAAMRVVEAARRIYEGTRDYAARGLGATWQVDYEMPPSTNKRVRRELGEALDALDGKVTP